MEVKDFYSDIWRILGEISDEATHSANDPWTRHDGAVGDDDHHHGSAFTGTPADIFKVAFEVYKALVPRFLSSETVRDHAPDNEDVLLSVLAICLRQGLRAESTHSESLMKTVATASRNPRWWKLFGTAVQRLYRYDPMPRPEQPPDSILLVALDVLASKIGLRHGDVLRDALRLVNNCCQDDDGNRQIVLDHNGVSCLMSLACRRVEPDFVVPALYNICVDHEPATHQLIHWEEDTTNTGARPNLEDSILLPSPSEAALQILLGLTDVLRHEERKVLLADLLELASQSVAQDLDSLREEHFHEKNLDDRRISLLTQLIQGPGSRLAASDTECRLAVCNTLINLLSHNTYKKALIAGDLLRSFTSIAYPNPPKSLQADSEPDEPLEPDENVSQCRQGVMKILYPICALPAFATAYPLGTALAQNCLTVVRAPHLTKSKPNTTNHSAAPFPLSIACVILASLTQSKETALALIADHKISEPLPALLSSTDSPDILYPALSFVGRLALSAANRPALLKHGLLAALHRFLTPVFDAAPAVQREAVTATRRLAAGSTLQTLTSTSLTTEKLATEKPSSSSSSTSHSTDDDSHNDSDSDSFLTAALTLFHRSDDGALKLEIGRLAIEICRSLWPSSSPSSPPLPSSSPANRGNPEDAETDAETNTRFNATLGELSSGSSRCIFASAIAFVILRGENAGAHAEGWFGFALLSTWAAGREMIVQCLSDEGGGGGEDMRAELRRVVAEGAGPAYQNLRVVVAELKGRGKGGLGEMDAFVVSAQTRAVLESAAEGMGLGRLWAREE